MPPDEPNFALGFLDFPTAWWLAARVEHTDPRCSYVQHNGGFLCDCGAIEAEFERRRTDRVAVDPQPEERNA